MSVAHEPVDCCTREKTGHLSCDDFSGGDFLPEQLFQAGF